MNKRALAIARGTFAIARVKIFVVERCALTVGSNGSLFVEDFIFMFVFSLC